MARAKKPPAEPAWPADNVERWPIDKLTPYARNPRTHDAAQVQQIVASIREWGWTTPILVDEKGEIIAGHGRVMAAELLEIKTVPVMVARDWTEAQKRAYVIADNQIPQNAGWDEALLRIEIGELKKLDFDLPLLGFNDLKLVEFTTGVGGADADPDEPVEPEVVPISRAGDLWLLGKHRLICGDSTDRATVEKVLAGAKPHLMVTDPPYGVSYDPKWRERHDQFKRHAVGKVENDDRADWSEAWALFPGDVAYVWHGGLHTAVVQQSLEKSDFLMRAQIVWAKQHFVFGRGDYHWKHEPCWYAVRKGKTAHWSGDRKQTTIWDDIANHNPMGGKPEDMTTGHGTQKPVMCMKRPIENNSKRGDTVYEPFAGSGTTIIAAEMTERVCLAVELSPAYVDVCVRRWQKFTGSKAILAGTKRTFDHIAKERVAKAA